MQSSAHLRTLRVSLLILERDARRHHGENGPAFRCEPWVPVSGTPRRTVVSAGEPAAPPGELGWKSLCCCAGCTHRIIFAYSEHVDKLGMSDFFKEEVTVIKVA